MDRMHSANLPTLYIRNVISTFNLKKRLQKMKLTTKQLHSFASAIQPPNKATYNPERFNALITRMRESVRATTLLFPTGKIVCLGATSEQQSNEAALAFVSLLTQAYESARKGKTYLKRIGTYEFQIRNIVGSATLPFKLDFNAFCRAYPRNAIYEPELFPGLHFRLDAGNIVCILFTSGKLIITGSKSQNEIENIYKHLFSFLEFFNKCRLFKNVLV